MKKGFKGETFALMAVIMWGINYPMAKQILNTVSETQFVLIRFSVAFIVLLGYLFLTGENLYIRKQHLGRILILGMLGVGLYNIIWTQGIHYTTSANAALIASSSPIFTAFFAMFRKDEYIGLSKWMGIFIAFLGIFLIISFSPGAEFRFDSRSFLGDILILVGTTLVALYSILAKPLLEFYSPRKLTALAMTGGLVVIISYSFIKGETHSVLQGISTDPFSFGYVILFGTVGAFILWYKGVNLTTPLKALLFHFLIPVTSMLLGTLVFHERIHLIQILGVCLILGSLLFIQSMDQRRFVKKPEYRA